MSFKSFALAALIAGTTLPALAGDRPVMIKDPYARSSGPTAKTGAAFMQIMNHSDAADRLISVSSGAAKRVELHTHLEQADGVMKMVHVEEGFELPSGGMLILERGGKHVMLMGLTAPLTDGESFTLELTFEKAGTLSIDIPVDQTRTPQDAGHGHGTMKMEASDS